MSCAEVRRVKSTGKTLRSNRRALAWCGLCLFCVSAPPPTPHPLLLTGSIQPLFSFTRLFPQSFQPSQEMCATALQRAASRSPCVGCLSKRTHVRASGVYQLFTQRERRLIVVWWHKSRLSVVAAGGGTSRALVCTRSPLTFQSQHINTAFTCPRPLPEPPSCYRKTRTDPVFHCLKKK